jgi:hypothetical protein
MGTSPDFSRQPLAANPLLAGAFLLWILAVGIGAGVLFSYSNTPGPPASPPNIWPADTAIRPPGNRARLIVFLHPNCPCSRATIAELARLMARCQSRAEAYVAFLAPRSQSRKWVRTGLWKAASAIPGAHAIEDEDGKEMRRFGARTSGQSLLYDAGGHLLFSGGLTISRGHEGANDGADAVLSLLRGAAFRPPLGAPVFGCSLWNEARP